MFEQTENTKAVVSISEMARMVGLSRSRFHQLIGTTFPWPLYDVSTRRPFYDEMLQHSCLEARRRNCGIDGKPVLFYSRRTINFVRQPNKIKPPKHNQHTDLLDGLKGLGLVNVTAAQVDEAVKKLFPHWEEGSDQSGVLRVVFLHLKRQNTKDKVQ
jgi:hypothetical protein